MREIHTREGSLAGAIYREVRGLNVGESVRFPSDASKASVRVTLHFLGKRCGASFAVNQREPGAHVITREE